MKCLADIFEEPITGEWGDPSEDGNGVKIIRTTNFTNTGKLDLNKGIAYRKISPSKVDKKKLQYGDVIIEKSGGSSDQPVGRVVFFDINDDLYLCNNFTAILRTRNQHYPKYCFYALYYLHKNRTVIKFQNKTTGIINLKLNDYLKSTRIPLPPIETQKKIADVLDKAQELIDKRKQQIEKLDEFVQSVFYDMFGNLMGKTVPLSSACVINPSKSEVTSLDEATEVTFLPMASVTEDGNIDLSEVRLLAEVKTGFTYFKDGDVLFAKITPCMENGKGAIVKGLKNGLGFGSTEFHVLRPGKNITSEWLYYLTKLKNFRIQAEKRMTGSAGQKRVPKQFFASYNIVVPPIDLQNKFIQLVQKTEHQKHLMQKSLTQMENNFNSIMHRAFRGELF